MSRVRSWTFEIPMNHGFKLFKCVRFDVELPFEVRAHFTFHLVDLPKGKHTTNDTPRFVGVSVIADDLRSNHERRDEEAVTGGTACCDEPRLQSLEKIESSKGHGGGEPHAMESASDNLS